MFQWAVRCSNSYKYFSSQINQSVANQAMVWRFGWSEWADCRVIILLSSSVTSLCDRSILIREVCGIKAYDTSSLTTSHPHKGIE